MSQGKVPKTNPPQFPPPIFLVIAGEIQASTSPYAQLEAMIENMVLGLHSAVPREAK